MRRFREGDPGSLRRSQPLRSVSPGIVRDYLPVECPPDSVGIHERSVSCWMKSAGAWNPWSSPNSVRRLSGCPSRPWGRGRDASGPVCGCQREKPFRPEGVEAWKSGKLGREPKWQEVKAVKRRRTRPLYRHWHLYLLILGLLWFRLQVPPHVRLADGLPDSAPFWAFSTAPGLVQAF